MFVLVSVFVFVSIFVFVFAFAYIFVFVIVFVFIFVFVFVFVFVSLSLLELQRAGHIADCGTGRDLMQHTQVLRFLRHELEKGMTVSGFHRQSVNLEGQEIYEFHWSGQ